jgi:hypothetical protein
MDVTADALGEYHFVLRCMFVLFGAVQGAFSLEALSLSFSSTRDVGSPPSFAANSDQLGLSDISGKCNNDTNDSSIA